LPFLRTQARVSASNRSNNGLARLLCHLRRRAEAVVRKRTEPVRCDFL
jgi:hypothetical protein